MTFRPHLPRRVVVVSRPLLSRHSSDVRTDRSAVSEVPGMQESIAGELGSDGNREPPPSCATKLSTSTSIWGTKCTINNESNTGT